VTAPGGLSTVRAVTYTTLAMLAFAGNSILCRLALRDGTIDPASFTSIRLTAGAFALLLIFRLLRRDRAVGDSGGWISAAMLFLYAICFSYAYVTLNAGAGALILFGCVQATMILIGLRSGDRPGPGEWVGWIIASVGLLWLLLPGASSPPMVGALMMAIAGVAWGIYSIKGRGEADALGATAANFLLTLVFVVMLSLLTFKTADISTTGVVLAIASGALTSGIGYVVWYAALESLSAMRAALVQLSVPVIAATGGALLLSEPLSLQLMIASALVLGGISFALVTKTPAS